METEINLHHIEIEIIRIDENNEITFDISYFDSEKHFFKVIRQFPLKKKVGESLYISAVNTKIT